MQVQIGNTVYFITRDHQGRYIYESVDTDTGIVRYHQDAFGQPLAFASPTLCVAFCQANHKQ